MTCPLLASSFQFNAVVREQGLALVSALSPSVRLAADNRELLGEVWRVDASPSVEAVVGRDRGEQAMAVAAFEYDTVAMVAYHRKSRAAVPNRPWADRTRRWREFRGWFPMIDLARGWCAWRQLRAFQLGGNRRHDAGSSRELAEAVFKIAARLVWLSRS